jgi:hypothetical protein
MCTLNKKKHKFRPRSRALCHQKQATSIAEGATSTHTPHTNITLLKTQSCKNSAMLTQTSLCTEHVRLVCWHRLLCIRRAVFTQTNFSFPEFRQKKRFLPLIGALSKCRHFYSLRQNEEGKHHSEHHSWEKIRCHFAKHHGTNTWRIAPAEHLALGSVRSML